MAVVAICAAKSACVIIVAKAAALHPPKLAHVVSHEPPYARRHAVIGVAVGVGESVGDDEGVRESVGEFEGVDETVPEFDGVGETVIDVDRVSELVGDADWTP